MAKNFHEIRDPIHVFIKLDTDERKILDSQPFQRLRHIHQLAMSYLVYPGATHKRFEHSLGVMELAGRIFDVITHKENVHGKIRELLPEISVDHRLHYWRRALRMAALCHDLGHLPFSHAAEKELLPEDWSHEKLTVAFINSPEMREIWNTITPPLRPEDIIKLAVGPKKLKDVTFSDWEAIMAEIIVGDSFGVDRIDYLLRDSYHAGVTYGKFDHFRLIDTLRILPRTSGENGGSQEPMLGVEEGGLHSAEALLLARYFMYSQVYFHPIRRSYDIHLKDFLLEWLPGGKFPTDIKELILITDNEVLVELLGAARDTTKRGHDAARRIVKREHYKKVYQKNPDDIRKNPESGEVIFEALKEKYGENNVRRDFRTSGNSTFEFPILCNDGRIAASFDISQVLQNLPEASFDYIFIRPDLREQAYEWLRDNRDTLLTRRIEEE
ncbi:MAG: HD domain-containing protein [Thermacetogeniaceae bacterium]|jgi:HD superfamily phosphohydrolase